MSERQTEKYRVETGRGVRGPNIPDNWKKYIVDLAVVIEPHKPRMLLADEIVERMRQSRDIKDRLPERESIAKLISSARTYPKSSLDEPWSIAASVKYGISPEASKDLFDIWRFSLAMDRPISIRQAKWIAYIRNLFYQPISTGNRYSDKVNRNLWLIRQSWLYSILERASRIMGEEHFDTTDLDAASFMPTWEYATALKLGKVSHVNYSQEAMTRIEKHGTSLTSPPHSVKSVEQAVWHNVRTEPPQHMEIMGLGFTNEVLQEEDDLIAAYWLMYLSKGPLWNNLPERAEVSEILKARRQQREKGVFVPDSGGFPDDSLYSRQLAIRIRLREWVKKHSPMTIRDYHTLTAQHPALVLSPKLLTMVGYEVPPEDLKLYAKLHENELKQEHLGWDLIPAEVQQRFINDNETDEDLDLLNNADSQKEIEKSKREQEFIKLVQQSGGEPKIGKAKFWQSIRAEWIKKYPKASQQFPEAFQMEYVRLIKEGKVHLNREKEAHNERSHSQEVQE